MRALIIQSLTGAMMDREDQRGSVFSWGWRPVMSWVLLFLWLWNGMIRPVANATAGTSIVPIPWEHLLGFARLWLAIYGGGHTISRCWEGSARARPQKRWAFRRLAAKRTDTWPRPDATCGRIYQVVEPESETGRMLVANFDLFRLRQ